MRPTHGHDPHSSKEAVSAYLRAVVEETAARWQAGMPLPRVTIDGRPIEAVSALRGSSQLALLAPPGSGKTTLLRAALAAEAEAALAQGSQEVPLYLDLGRARQGEGIDELIGRALIARGLDPDTVRPGLLLLDHLEQNSDYYLMDGLEMLLTAGGSAGPRVILACRDGEWPSYLSWFADAVVAEVQPLEAPAIAEAAATLLAPEATERLATWLERDPELARAVRRPLALRALLTVVTDDTRAWSRVKVVDTLLDAVLSNVPSTERSAYRAALADVALSAHGRAFVDGVDTMAMGLGVTRDAMIRTGAVVAHGPSLEFVEPLLARHCAAVALSARFGPQPTALLARLGGSESPGAVDVLVHLYGMSDDPEAFAAALLEAPNGEEIVARCLVTPPVAPEEGVRRLLARDSDFGESLRAKLAAVLGRLGADHASRLLRGGPDETPAAAVPAEAGDSLLAEDPAAEAPPREAAAERFARAETLAEEGRLGEAATLMREVVAQVGEPPAGWLDALGQIELELGHGDSALDLLQRAHGVSLATDEPSASLAAQAAGLRRVARAQLQLGRAEEATALLSRAAGMAGDDAGVLADLGRARAAAGQWSAAIDALRAAIALDDLWPEDHRLLADLRARLGVEETCQAEEPFRAPAEDDADLAPPIVESVGPEEDLAVTPDPGPEPDHAAPEMDSFPAPPAPPALAEEVAEMPDPAAAPTRAGRIDLLDEGGSEAEAEPEPEPEAATPRQGSAAMVQVARLYEESGELEAALAAYERAAAQEPVEAGLLRKTGEIARSLGRVELAIGYLARGAETGDGDVAALRSLGEALREAGRLEEAEKALSRVVEVAPEDAAGRRALVDLLAEAGRPEEALEILQPALEAAPREAGLRGLAGELSLAAGDASAARAAFEQALALAPSDLPIGLRLADLLQAEDPSRALELLEHLPPAAEVMRRRARLHARDATWPEAARCWREAREAGDQSDSTLTALGDALLRAERPREAVTLLEAAERSAEGSLSAEARAVLAQALEASGRERDALVAYSAAADESGLDDERWLAYSRLAARLGAVDEAIRAAQRAVTARPDAVEPALALAEAYEQHGLIESALRALRTAVTAAPERTALRIRLADLERSLGRPEAAVATLEAALSACPSSGALHGALGEAMLAAGRPQDAQAQLDEALRLAPEEARWAVGLARCVAEERPEQAITLLRDALRLRPSAAEPATLLGGLLASEGRDAEALSVLERAAELAPDSGDVARDLGEVRLRLGDAEGAILALRRATRLSPEEAEVWAALAKAESRAEQLPAAEDSLARAVGLAPERSDLALRLGELRLRRCDVSGALTVLERAVEIDPDDPRACRLLAEALERDGRPSDALPWFAAAVRLDGGSAASLAGLGRTQLAGGDAEAARESLERAMTADGTPSDTRAWLADALSALGQSEPAMAQAAAAVRSDRSSLRARLALVRAYQVSGDDFGAREALDRTATIDSDDAELLRARAELAEALGDAHDAEVAGQAWLDAAPADVEAALALVERHAQADWPHPMCSVELAPPRAAEAVATALTLIEQALDEGRLRGARAARCARAVALAHGRAGDLDAARRAADGAVAADAADPRGFLVQAWTALIAGDGESALAATRMARARGSDEVALHVLAGRAHRLVGEGALAVESLKRAVERDPDNGEIGVLHGEALVEAGRSEAARAAFQSAGAAALDPATRRGLGRRALAAGELEQARLLLEPLTAPDSMDAEALALRAEACRGQGDLVGCVKAYERAVTLAPERAEWHAALGGILRERGSLAEARECYRRAVRLAPEEPSIRIAEAGAAIEDGDLPAARGTLEGLLALRPEHAEAQAMLARMALAEGKADEARERLSAAVANAPAEAELHRELGLVAKGLGDTEGARHALEESAELDPTSTETFLALGDLYVHEGAADDAIQAFEQAIVTAPDAVDAHLKLGRACAAAGMVERATAVLRRAGEIEPGDARPGHEIGRILAASGRYEQAVEAFEEALGIQDDLPELCFDAGDAWWRLHEYERAKDLLERAHGLRPTRDTGRKLAALNAIRFVGRFVPTMAGNGEALR